MYEPEGGSVMQAHQSAASPKIDVHMRDAGGEREIPRVRVEYIDVHPDTGASNTAASQSDTCASTSGCFPPRQQSSSTHPDPFWFARHVARGGGRTDICCVRW